MFNSHFNKTILESVDENLEIIEQYKDGEGKLILNANNEPVAILEYEIYDSHCSIGFLESYTENKGYATLLVKRLKEILKSQGIKTIGASATVKSQNILKKIFGEPISKEDFGWDEGIGENLWNVKHNINESYLVEARSDYLLQNKKLVTSLLKKVLLIYLTQEEARKWMEENSSEEVRTNFLRNKFFKELEKYKFIDKYLIWVVKQYLNNYWKFPEDCEQLNKELETFSKFSHTLDKTDINQYSYEEFADLVLKLEGQQTSNEKERMIKDKEAEKIFEDSEWILIHPITKNAAILYGKGTRWCTAATSGYNYFDHYNIQGPLYILINKQNPEEKYQFHWESKSFMNKQDVQIDTEEKARILSDSALKNKLIEIISAKKTSKEESEQSYLAYICDTLHIYDEDSRLLPDENGICHIALTDSEVARMYTEGRESVSWDLVSKVFTQEGLDFSSFDYNDYYTDSDYCDLTKEQIELFYKILNENNLPAIANRDIEYLIMDSNYKVDQSTLDLYEDIFEETNEKSEVSIKYNDCYMFGQEIEATNDIEKQLLEYFGYNAHFDWIQREKRKYNAEKNQYESYSVDERVIKFDVPAKDLHIPSLNKEEIEIFPEQYSDYEVSFIEYLINTLYNYDKCSVGEPYYGWDGFDEETWKDFITNEYIPIFKEVIESNPERLERIRKEYQESLETEDFEESVLNKSVKIIKEKNKYFKPNTFKRVFNKLEEKELDEGKFGKFLGTMATAAAIGLGGLHNNAQATQYNPNNQEQVIDYKFAGNQEIPSWIEHAGELSMKDGNIVYVADNIANSKSNNTSHLERVGQMKANIKFVSTVKNAINKKINGKLNKLGDNITMSGMKPTKNFWLLLNGNSGKEYHTYNQIEISQDNLVKSMVNNLKKVNPNASQQQLTKIV